MINPSLDESAGFRLCFTVGIPWWRTAGRHGRCRSDWTMSEKLRVKTVFCFFRYSYQNKEIIWCLVFRWCDFACQTFTPMWKRRMTGRSSGWWYLIQVVESKLHRVDQSIAAWSWTNYLVWNIPSLDLGVIISDVWCEKTIIGRIKQCLTMLNLHVQYVNASWYWMFLFPEPSAWQMPFLGLAICFHVLIFLRKELYIHLDIVSLLILMFFSNNKPGSFFLQENELQSLSLEESMTSVVARASATKRRSKAVFVEGGRDLTFGT